MNNKFYQMNQEFFLRDDIMDLSSRLDSENYNIKAYRKRNKSQTHKNHKNFLLSTEVITSDVHDDLKDKSAEPTQRTTQILSAKRLSVTAGVRKRSHLHEAQFPGFVKTARTKNNSVLEEPTFFQQRKDRTIMNIKGGQIKEPVIGNFSKLQKEYSKGGQLKNKHLENWLNQILLQYCHEEKFDSTIENPALKKYGIDKNSLLSKGINPQNLERIYKSLFVYSMGFNTLLKEIGSKNMNIRKTFWKVYAILLEYCSDGDFDTMIGQIERDKVRKMEIMKEEIQRRQEIIENNEEINQQKNAKIFKELKQLRQENSNLQNDKNVLMEDYKEAEQAFNEEVSLRLKFENKINEIHGVHRELGIKHQKLYDDLQSKNYESMTIKDKLARITEQYIVLKTESEYLKKENSTLKTENEFSYTLVEEMKKKATLHELQEIQWKHKKEQFVIMLREKEKKIQQVRGQLKNSQLILTMKEKAQAQLQKQYKRALQENKQLVSSLQKELEQINVYMLEKKEFNDTHSRIYAELQIANRYLAARDEALQSLRKQLSSVAEEIDKKDIQIETLQNKNKQFDRDVKDLYVKIGEMKKIKTAIEEQLTQSKSREEYYKNFYYEKEKVIASLTEKLEENQRLIAQFNLTKKTLQSKVSLLTQKIASQEQTNRKKIDKLKGQINSLDRTNKAMKAEVEEKTNQVERATALYEDTFNKLKDQMFERNDLQLRYNQSLSVVQSETEHIKKLNIKISEMQEKHEDMVRKLKGVEFILQNKQKTYQKQVHQYNATIHHLKDQIKQRKMFIHPMKYEDLLSQFQRKQQLLAKIIEKAEAEKKRVNIELLQSKLKHVESDLFQSQIHFAQEIQVKNRAIDHHMTRIEELQQMMEQKYSKDRQNEVDSSPKINYKEKQRKYLEIIKQKTKQLEDLLVQVEKIQDQNNSLMGRLSNAQAQLRQKTEKLQSFENQVSQIQSERHALNLQKANIFKEKEKLLVQMSDQESRIIQAQDKGYLGIPSNRELKSQQKSSRIENVSRESNSREKNQPGWRNDFSKKMKNAVNYYKK